MSYRGHSKGSYGIRKLQRFHARRSNKAKRIDEGLRAPIAKTPEQWMQQPNQFDIPNVDTPKKSTNKQEEPQAMPTASTPQPSHSQNRTFTKSLDRQAMRKVSGTRY